MLEFSIFLLFGRVSDPHSVNADPDPAFCLIADPDPGPYYEFNSNIFRKLLWYFFSLTLIAVILSTNLLQ